jgi:hypothetical protein
MSKMNQKTKAKSVPASPFAFYGQATQPLPVQARTHEGGPAITFSPQDQLRRAVLSCLLWEKNFYESGKSIADRIAELVKEVDPEYTKDLARVARTQFKLRHVPLYLVTQLLSKRGVRDMDELIYDVVQRADEPAELVSMYWASKKKPLAAALKRGLAGAITKFDEYQLAKWQGADKPVKLRDVMFLCHAKPITDSQAALWKRFIAGEIKTPDTWEVALSAGKDKKETFTRLIQEKKLGYMALLRNLRNMRESGVDPEVVQQALLAGAINSRALPFRYIAAARACPEWEPMLDQAMQMALSGLPQLKGMTDLVIDVSGSMNSPLSQKSDLRRIDAACGLAILLAGVCEAPRIWTFSDQLVRIAPRKGMALRDAIRNSQPSGGTYLGNALRTLYANSDMPNRTIIITDEQAHDAVGAPRGNGYMLDVAGMQNGVGYGNWTWISGFSEAVVGYIAAIEYPTQHAMMLPSEEGA